jgi:hypothetical protein
LEARWGQLEAPTEDHFELMEPIQGQKPEKPAPTDLKKAQIPPISAINLTRLPD